MTNDQSAPKSAVPRRAFIGQALGIGAMGTILATGPWSPQRPGGALSAFGQPAVRPRSDWDQGNGPTGSIEAETPLFLLVHHTAQPGNDYEADAVPALLRSMYWYHSGEEKGWPDIAYNFLVDQFGTVWEGRTGSIAGPVRGSATGGNQGFSQLCCFIGNLNEAEPTEAARQSMADLLAWLAQRYAIDTQAGATTSFVSRGSNKWASGTTVTTSTIAGHRDMSQTSCPGDSGYKFVTERLPALVAARLGDQQTSNTTSTNPTTTEPDITTTAQQLTTHSTTDSSTTTSSTQPADPPSSSTALQAAPSVPQASPIATVPGSIELTATSVTAGQLAAGAAIALGGAGLILLRRRSANGVDSGHEDTD